MSLKWKCMIKTLQVVLLGNGERQKADVAQRRGPVVRAQVDQAKLRGTLRVGEGQHSDQQEAHSHHKLEENRNDRASVSLLSVTEHWARLQHTPTNCFHQIEHDMTGDSRAVIVLE